VNHYLRSLGVSLLAALALSGSLAAQDNFSPARYRAGPMPAMPVLGIGGGQVFVEVSVGPDGRVLAVTPIRTTPGFTDFVVRAVGAWQFVPAEVEVDPEPGKPLTPRPRRRIASKVLVAAVFRPPALIGPTIGEHPKDVASESDETPFPLTTGTPSYPVMAKDGGTVLVEVRVDPGGRVDGAAVIVSAPPFDDVALETVGQWSFRPARVRGKSVSTLAYIVFGFPSLDRAGTNKPGTINR
jgi:TonB family protein